MEQNIREVLISHANRYETKDFLDGDPSWFMHQVNGAENQEAMAFIASCLSYGSRQQFMKKIELIRQWSEGNVHEWVLKGAFDQQFKEGDTRCFYRLYNNDTMNRFLTAYQHLLKEHGTLGNYVRQHAPDGLSAVKAICDYFAQQGISVVVPKDTQSACKRVCMFLRWMVRSDSPVDIGLWADFIDRRTIIMPMDTHVLNQSMRMGLLKSRTTSMSSAIRLTAELAKIFPEDPLKGDFALFGYGVNEATSSHT